MPHLDLSAESGLRVFLAETPFAAHTIQILSGGTANFAFRLHLDVAYKGHATVVLKHAKPYVATSPNLPFDVGRQKFEVEALREVLASLPADAVVTVPEVHLYDEENAVIIMDDCGTAVPLKQLMIENPPSIDISTQIGRGLAEFLSSVHTLGTRKPSVADYFDRNEVGKKMTAWAFHGRVLSTLASNDLPYLPVPPHVSDIDLEAMGEIAEEAQRSITASSTLFTMGDFWPGNIMVNIQDGKLQKIHVLDWELSKTGLSSSDIGQFIAEMHLLRRFHSNAEEASLATTKAFLTSYRELCGEQAELAGRTMIHTGAHLIVWTPRVKWGGPEQTEAVVKEGIECVLNGGKRDAVWLKTSLIGDLVIVEDGSRDQVYAWCDKGRNLFYKQSMATEVYLPPNLPYPIKIVSLDAKAQTSVQRGTRLLSYSFVHLTQSTPETRFGTWDAPLEGIVDGWTIHVADVITDRKAQDRHVLLVTEPCKHGVQIGGLCGLCGKDMTDDDYTGFSDASRASIQMTHSAFGPTVSLEEAQRLERESAEHLLKSRKLSLIVDLDQTVVHATVDPTVGEWIAQGEAWEAERERDGLTSDGGCGPNWEALKDVKKFRLGPESFVAPSGKGKGKHHTVEVDGSMYYIKPRPGWEEFLKTMSTKYEMHVYTMGTRAYAEQVCIAIDPDRKVFGGRILSRDESGSLTQKSLQRLFPCDTSMVVIIDDRADVWEWSPNLVKVIPYDFFVGIGDINSSFLPKLQPLTAIAPKETVAGGYLETANPDAVVPDTSPEAAEAAEAATTSANNVMLVQNSRALQAQLEERPLAKKQEELQDSSPESIPEEKEKSEEPSPKTDKHVRKALLNNDDTELDRISRLLTEIHSRFFNSYDNRPPEKKGRPLLKRAPKVPYDVTAIIPSIRTETLQGVHILFSSVIPLDTRAEDTEIWKMAQMFGARCSTELNSAVTHVVSTKRGTVKVETARKKPGIKIVWLAWFTDSIARWQRQDENMYLLDDLPVAGPSKSPSIPLSMPLQPDPEGKDLGEEVETFGAELGDLDEIDWNKINDEVDAAMNESDDEDERSERSSRKSEYASDEDESRSVTSTPRKRKRFRSETPDRDTAGLDDDVLRSPLSKRKKMAAERSGYSRLKEEITADDFEPHTVTNDVSMTDDLIAKPGVAAENEEEESSGEDYASDETEDFLAGEIEEWG